MLALTNDPKDTGMGYLYYDIGVKNIKLDSAQEHTKFHKRVHELVRATNTVFSRTFPQIEIQKTMYTNILSGRHYYKADIN